MLQYFQSLQYETIATVVVAVAAVISLGIQYFKKEKPWKDTQDKHRNDIIQLKTQVEALQNQLDLVKDQINRVDSRELRNVERLSNKIEKLMDMLIKLINEKS